MGSQQNALQGEHDLASDIFELSDGKIIPIRAGYSGNQSLPMPDLFIPFGGAMVVAEMKSTANDTSIIITPEDVEQIRYWTLRHSEVPTYPYLFIKFRGRSSRLIYATRLTRLSDPEKAFTMEARQCPFDAKVTRTGNLSFRKPDLDQWPSTKGGDGPKGKRDAYQVLETLRNDEFEQPSVMQVIKQRDDFFEQLGEE